MSFTSELDRLSKLDGTHQPDGVVDDLGGNAGAPVQRVAGRRGWHNRQHQSLR